MTAMRPLVMIAAFLAAAWAAAAQAPPRPGPVCVWTFDHGSLRDEAGRGRDQLSAFTHAGAVVLPRFVTADDVAGVKGKAVALGATPDDAAYLAACTSPDVRLGPSYSVAIRFHPLQLGTWARLVLRWGPGLEHAYHVAVHNGQASLYHGQADGTEAICEGGKVEAGRWHVMVAVAERNDAQPAKSALRVYLDGTCAATVAYDGTWRATVGEGLGIGDSASAPGEASRFAGFVDEVMLWSRALTADEVGALGAPAASRVGPPE
ncbi:LamG domain-containing protein [bacterium]|nr:LamG domain-containing protein [bacterium]